MSTTVMVVNGRTWTFPDDFDAYKYTANLPLFIADVQAEIADGMTYLRTPAAVATGQARAMATGALTLTLDAAATLSAGLWRIQALDVPTDYMIGTLSADLVAGTALTLTVSWTSSAATHSNWLISPHADNTSRRRIVAVSADYAVAVGDHGALIDMTGSHAIALLAPATAGTGFSIGARNVGTGTVTLTGTVDGTVNPTLAAGQTYEIVSDGVAWRSTVRPVDPTTILAQAYALSLL